MFLGGNPFLAENTQRQTRSNEIQLSFTFSVKVGYGREFVSCTETSTTSEHFGRDCYSCISSTKIPALRCKLLLTQEMCSADYLRGRTGAHHERVIEGCEDVSNAKDVLALCHLGAESYPLLHLVLPVLLARLLEDETNRKKYSRLHHKYLNFALRWTTCFTRSIFPSLRK